MYEIGVLCETKVIKDEKNLFMPYVLNLFPVEKAKLVGVVKEDEIIGPLTRVIVEKIREEMLTENELDTNQSVTFKFLRQ